MRSLSIGRSRGTVGEGPTPGGGTDRTIGESCSMALADGSWGTGEIGIRPRACNLHELGAYCVRVCRTVGDHLYPAWWWIGWRRYIRTGLGPNDCIPQPIAIYILGADELSIDLILSTSHTKQTDGVISCCHGAVHSRLTPIGRACVTAP